MSVNINGAVITDDITSVLKEWQNNDNVPAMYVEKLCGLQDFFCRMLVNDYQNLSKSDITGFLTDIITMKDDLRMFNIESKRGSARDTDSSGIQ